MLWVVIVMAIDTSSVITEPSHLPVLYLPLLLCPSLPPSWPSPSSPSSPPTWGSRLRYVNSTLCYVTAEFMGVWRILCVLTCFFMAIFALLEGRDDVDISRSKWMVAEGILRWPKSVMVQSRTLSQQLPVATVY